eukprot:TRINITY_DN98797_c0_g1_i1.p1 TRINITY_DN98797_c0_g1~~TRINITY_DN98797_c0_g1_i1.p1  ORF type:complete len:268 (-),score=52.02 TRINITY_DN98797_c0_g1_i1:117-920(-)
MDPLTVMLILPFVLIVCPCILGSAVAVGSMAVGVGIAGLAAYALLRGVASITPVVRDIIPEPVSEEELRRLDAEADAREAAEKARIDAEIEEAMEKARIASLPKTPEEAQLRLGDAQAAVAQASAWVTSAEEAAKARSGGWGDLCDARAALQRAEADLAQLQTDVALLLPCGDLPQTALGPGAANLEVVEARTHASPRIAAVSLAHQERSPLSQVVRSMSTVREVLPMKTPPFRHSPMQAVYPRPGALGSAAFRRTALRSALAALRR